MDKTAFDIALKVTLGFEGGKVDHPKDPGGRTNQGITQRTYDAYRKRLRRATRDVYHMEDDERDAIYRHDYWGPSSAGLLPPGLDLMVFDFAVNSGVSRAVRTLQSVLGVTADGVVGSATRAAIKEIDTEGELTTLILDYADARLKFVKSLSTWGTFGKGWTRRIIGRSEGAQAEDTGVVDHAYALAARAFDKAAALPVPAAIGANEGEVNGKAQDKDVAIAKSAPALGALGVTAGTTGTSIIAAAQQVAPHIATGLFGSLALGAFALLLLAGGILLAFSWYRKLKDTGLSFKELFQ